ncbi:hypothetical protein [Allokutzneria sp. NRRL B-24872]|uniref:hypothetical protein n=1 Tax=Allokutzneria sp. NRRL B-24872 TaxID=1137961 RepID=UPI000A3883C4|nr:hypothetical protein [Allokutzneria sp. NRRL B-24872]
MSADARTFTAVATQVGGVWLVTSATAALGLPVVFGAAFSGAPLFLLVGLLVIAVGMALLLGVGAATASSSAMTAEPGMRVWWTTVITGVGGVLLVLTWRLGLITAVGMPWSLFLSGVPFAVVALVLAIWPRSGA